MATKFELGHGVSVATAPDSVWLQLSQSVLAVPALMAFVIEKCPTVCDFYTKQNIGTRCVNALLAASAPTDSGVGGGDGGSGCSTKLQGIFSSLGGNGTLCLLGNLLSLAARGVPTMNDEEVGIQHIPSPHTHAHARTQADLHTSTLYAVLVFKSALEKTPMTCVCVSNATAT